MPATLTRQSAFICVVLLFAGCGQSTPDSATTATPESSSVAAVATQTAAGVQSAEDSVGTGTTIEPGLLAEAEPVEGTPEWTLQEILKIRLLPLPAVDLPEVSDDEAGAIVEASATAPAEVDRAALQAQLAATREIRRERNQQIVTLAMSAISQTAKDPEKEEVFLAAVRQMLDAQLQLALQGDEASIAALYDAAEAFYAKMPQSQAAAQSQLSLVNLAHANALRYAKSEPRWLQEFSRHAQLFATRFPAEGRQALPQLVAAGRSCELNGLLEEARSCFSLVQTKFSDTPQAAQVAGIQRRLNLQGQRIEFAGPTLDGNYVSLEEHAGKTVIIVFWATHATPFLQHVSELQALADKYKKYAQVVSVNLDSEDLAIDKFLEESNLNWPVIFHPEHDKRGWNAPLAAHYGVTSLPTIWIVDPTGVVAETNVTPESLEAQLRAVILKHRTASSSSLEKNSGETLSKS